MEKERPKIEKAVHSDVKVKQGGFFTKLRMLYDDAQEKVDFVLNIINTAQSVMEIIFKGANRNNISFGKSKTRISYNDYFEEPRRTTRNSERDLKPNEVIFNSRTDAQNVLDRLGEYIDRYGNASVLDFFDAAGVTTNYTNDYMGWDSMRGFMIQRDNYNDGWTIRTPRSHYIK